jgi:hypothetical protein
MMPLNVKIKLMRPLLQLTKLGMTIGKQKMRFHYFLYNRLNVEKEMGEYVERKFRAGSTKAKVIFDKNNLL